MAFFQSVKITVAWIQLTLIFFPLTYRRGLTGVFYLPRWWRHRGGDCGRGRADGRRIGSGGGEGTAASRQRRQQHGGAWPEVLVRSHPREGES
jgi:hypothetical protein